MTNYREILRLKVLGMNKQETAASVGCSRKTVAEVLRRAEVLKLSYPLPDDVTDTKLAELLYPSAASKPVYKMPDYTYVAKEMMKDGVTLNLLWLEYCEKCLAAGETPYQSTQFNKYYSDYLAKTNATMRLNLKPGEIMQVDWAGDTANIIDTDTGETIPAYVFVATLLKTGVVRHGHDEVELNKSYQELAEHYGAAILPARVRSPKDKAFVEVTVSVISTFILAALRNQRFLPLDELNTAIHERLYEFNPKPF